MIGLTVPLWYACRGSLWHAQSELMLRKLCQHMLPSLASHRSFQARSQVALKLDVFEEEGLDPYPQPWPSTVYSSPEVDRIWGIWGSYYNVPKATFYLLKGHYMFSILESFSSQSALDFCLWAYAGRLSGLAKVFTTSVSLWRTLVPGSFHMNL